MQILVPGHVYALDPNGEEIHFIRKTWEPIHVRDGEVLDPPGARKLVTRSGTTSEDVIEVLIDRTEFLDAQFPCDENKAALAALRGALAALCARTKKRIEQGVEGTLANHTA